jgi:CubicO group peptidase (beta-lactamase class C family)
MFILSLLILLPSCHVFRFFWWNVPNQNDYEKFPSLPVSKGEEVFKFYETVSNFQFSIPEESMDSKKYPSFEEYLIRKKTAAFLIIRNDSIIYENYFDQYNDTSVFLSFSTSKVFVSALVGIAIDEGYIYSTSQPVTFFLKELESKPEFRKITIEDLLNMRSGIKFSEAYLNPFGDVAKYYYGTNLKKYIANLKVKDPPDEKYEYISTNTLLLSLIVERATNTKFNKYFEEKLWKRLGMESDASWSIDSKKNQTIKSFCCLNARARDFARFGRLYLNEGEWEGKQIVPEKWVERSSSIINDSRDSQGYPYTYQWRVLKNGAFFAKGILGQYIFIYPEKNLIFVRLGKNTGNVHWPKLFLELSDQL